MSEKVVRRPADISPIEAKQGLALAFPTAKVASFDTVEHNGSFVYEAKLILSEFPPPSGGDDEDAPPSDGPPAPPDGGEDDGPPEDDGGDDDGGPPKEKKDKKEKGGDKIEHQILDALQQLGQGLGVPITVGEHDPGMDSAPPGAGGPEDDMGGAPPPPVADDAPLPPPAAPKGAPGGAGGGGLGMPFASVNKFAGDKHVASIRQSVAGRRSFSMAYEEGRTPMRVVADTAREMFPEFDLARIESRAGSIDGGNPQAMYVLGMVRRAG